MKIFVLMSHTLLEVQINELYEKLNVDEIIYLPEDLKKDFMQISDSNTKNIELLNKIKSFIENNKENGDYVLIQGEYGVTHYIVNWCFINELIPIYATSERIYEGENLDDGAILNKHIFKHKSFNKYIDLDIIDRLNIQFKNKDFIKTLDLLYLVEPNEFKSNEVEKKFFDEITESLHETFDINKINIYLDEINYYYDKNINKTNKGLFIALRIWEIINKNNIKVSDTVRYRLCDKIGAGYNHLGDIDKANYFFDKCISLSHSVNASTYIETINRLAVSETNEFNFSLAIEGLTNCAKKIEYWESLDCKMVESLMLNNERQDVLSLKGKIYSSIAQNYAYLGDKINSLKYFNKALDSLTGKSKSITISYLLHLAIDHGDIDLYEKSINEYILGETIEEQLEFVLNSKDSYKVYIFIKALNKLYYNKLSDDFIKKLVNINYEKYEFKVVGNPWQLIYKHLALILYKKNEIDRANKMIEKIEKVSFIKKLNNADEVTIKLINACTLLEVYEFNKNEEWKYEALKSIEKICNSRKVLKVIFNLSLNSKTEDEKIKLYKEKFRFMFS